MTPDDPPKPRSAVQVVNRWFLVATLVAFTAVLAVVALVVVGILATVVMHGNDASLVAQDRGRVDLFLTRGLVVVGTPASIYAIPLALAWCIDRRRERAKADDRAWDEV